jgi:cysteine-rich repeat protein
MNAHVAATLPWLLGLAACAGDGPTALADDDATSAPSDSSGPESDDSSGESAGVVLEGALHKGPFVLGSSVSVSPIDAAGNPTGAVYSTATHNDLGEFSIELGAIENVALEGTGFYYNEVVGELSSAPLTLRGFYQLEQGEPASARLNVLTHLGYQRVRSTLAAAPSLVDAVSAAEAEVRAALGVGPAGYDPGLGTTLDLLDGDGEPNAYLFAITSVLVQAAVTQAGPDGPIDATLQELLNSLALDLADDGSVAATVTEQLLAAQTMVDTAAVETALASRLAAIGSSAGVPDLDRFIDSDLDGVPNISDNCPRVVNPGQDDPDGDGIGHACDCGNAALDVGEQCDDGNEIDGDGCEADCTTPMCFNGVVDPGEVCYASQFIDVTVPYPDGAYVSWTELADVDGDGALDIVFGRDSDLIPSGHGVLLNDGAGGFGDIIVSPGPRSLRGVVLDLDEDGVLDVVGADAGMIYAALGNGDGTFGEPIDSMTADFIGAFGFPMVGDFIEDGRADLLMSTTTNGRGPVVLPGTGTGGFGEPVFTPHVCFGTWAFTVPALVDWNDDDHLDVIAVTCAAMTVFLGDGSGGFVAQPLEIEYLPSTSLGMVAFDVDDDDDPDLITVDAIDNVHLWRNDAGALTDGGVLDASLAVGYSPWDVVARDRDADGVLDLMVGWNDKVLVFGGDGQGGFRPAVPLTPSIANAGHARIATGELNGDGILDVVVQGGSQAVRVYSSSTH